MNRTMGDGAGEREGGDVVPKGEAAVIRGPANLCVAMVQLSMMSDLPGPPAPMPSRGRKCVPRLTEKVKLLVNQEF